jgi:hypothetical protein
MERGDTPPAVTEFLAECLWPGVTQAELDAADARARGSAKATAGTREEVVYSGSLLMPEDEVVFFAFGGPSARAVREVAVHAAIPFERIVESVRTAGTTEGKET